ncbi:MAG: hypothetical protein Q9209_006763 [Squamulea sp. 1 TL-2023]
MGKNRSYPAPGGKPFGHISTSGIFKQHKSYAPLKHGRQHPTDLPAFPVKKSKKRKHKTEHPLSKAFSDTIDDSCQTIENKTKARLDKVCDALNSQTRSIMHEARDRMEKADHSTKYLQRPLEDELLELTRKDGTIVTMTLGKRMDAYRKLVNREKENLNHLFEQWQDVSREINGFATTLFGSKGVESILNGTDAVPPELESAEQRALVAEMEAAKERARCAAKAIGTKAVKLMRTGEKASS